MSDNESGKASGAWTDEAKFQFLLRIVAQLKEDGKQINWQRFGMPGRTTKSLQNMWTKVNKQISDLNDEDAAEGGGVARKIATPRKSRAKKVQPEAVEDEEMAEAPTPKKTPRKRRSPAATTPKRTPKIRKGYDDEDVTTTPVKPERGEDSD